MASTEALVAATKDNLHIIFGSPSHEERMQHLARLWHPDALFIDTEGWHNTHEAVSAAVAKIQNPAWVFSEIGDVGVCAPKGTEQAATMLTWGYGPKGEEPVVKGKDFIAFRDGKVERLYTFLG